MADLVSRTSFVGREAELSEVAELLPEVPLVTLVGAAGIGKTRLAAHVAAAVEADFPDGVVSIDLAPTTNEELDVDRLAARLGHRSLGAAVEALAQTTTLILLDNCEHVVDSIAAPVHELIEQCRDVRVLATSRAPLELVDEHVYPLRPLPLDDALTLLRQRGQAAGAELPLGVDIDLHLTDVATRVDCLPLALELAAIRLRSLDPVQIVASLDANLELLRRGGRSGRDRRHDSVANAIEWSYALLDEEPASAFRRLGVLGPGFRLERAHDVIGATDLAESAELLDQLVAHSLVNTTVEAGRIRYGLLQTVRQYALDRLRQSGELDATVERFVESVRAVSDDLVRRAIARWDDQVVTDARDVAPELLAAVRACLDHDERGDRACAMMLPGWGLVHETYAGELAHLGTEIMQRWPADTPGWGDVAAITATASIRLSQLDEAVVQADEAVRVGGLIAVPVGRRARAMVLQHRGDFDEALAEVRWATDAAEQLGLAPFSAELTLFEATLLGQIGDLERAAQLAASARDRNAESAPVVNWSKVLEAYVTLDTDADRARRLADEVASDDDDIQRPGQPVTSTAMIARHLGSIALWHDDTRTAATWLRIALQASRQVGERPHAWSTLRCIGLAAARRGDLDDVEHLATSGRRLIATCASSPHTPAPGTVERRLATRLFVADTAALKVFDVTGTPYEIGFALLDDVMRTRAEHRVATLDGTAPERLGVNDEQSDSPVDGRIEFDGDICEIEWRGERARISTTKGLTDLAVLIRRAGVEIPAAELMGSLFDESSVDDSLDDSAKRALEQRLLDLQNEINVADADNDLARLEQLQAEFDRIVDHLTASFGLGGRRRTTGGSAEKARSAVTWRIRAAIRKIDGELPGLGRHLRASVRTGMFCAYDPEAPTAWILG